MDSKIYQNLINVNETDNLLYILYNDILFFYDGEKWGQFYISDVNLPDTDFRYLKKPGLVEIPPQQNSIKTFLVTGGFIPNSKEFTKTNYLLNIKKTIHKDDKNKYETTYDCLLDFKYGDMKIGRFLHGVVNILGQYVVTIGGKNGKGWLDSCEVLDIKTGEWKEFPSMNSPRANFDCLLYFNENETKYNIYAYGGFSNIGKFPVFLIETCEVNLKSLGSSKWNNIKLSLSDKEINLPKICSRIIRYDDNILIMGGSDGKHLLDNVFELDINSNEVNSLGHLKTSRNNFHVFYKEGDVYLVGGSCKEFYFKEDLIENYIEKFTFNLASQVESENIPLLKDIFLYSIENLSIDKFEFQNEPGFPYAASIVAKKF